MHCTMPNFGIERGWPWTVGCSDCPDPSGGAWSAGCCEWNGFLSLKPLKSLEDQEADCADAVMISRRESLQKDLKKLEKNKNWLGLGIIGLGIILSHPVKESHFDQYDFNI